MNPTDSPESKSATQLNPLNVLMFCATSSLYGAARAAVTTSIGLRNLGHQSSLAIGPGPLWELVEQEKLVAVEVPNKYWVYPEGGIFKGMRRFALNRSNAKTQAKILMEKKFNVCHSHSLMSPLGALLADQLKIPHVWHFHELVNTSPGHRFLLGASHARNFIDRSTDCIIVNSKFTADASSLYAPSGKTRLVYYGILPEEVHQIEPPERPPISPNRVIKLILVGSIQERKGQEDAILALAELVRTRLKATLTFVGEGPREYVQKLTKLAEDLGVAEQIHWAGFHNEPIPFYKEADIALVCSRDEPFGIITVEAMSLGLPTIGAKSGGVVEVISDGVNGLLYDPGDFKTLANRIALIVNKPELRSKLVESAYHSAFNRFGLTRYTREIESVYNEAIESYRSRISR